MIIREMITKDELSWRFDEFSQWVLNKVYEDQ